MNQSNKQGGLLLTRREGEGIVIDGDIHVSVSKIKGSRATLYIQAPPEVTILRDELTDDDDEAD